MDINWKIMKRVHKEMDYADVEWIPLAQRVVRCWALVNMVINPGLP
jgi:hypothetical protein